MTDKPDIVDRLRDKLGPGSKLTPTGNSAHPLLEEAADTIEALRKQADEATAERNQLSQMLVTAQIENARLREVLRAVLKDNGNE